MTQVTLADTRYAILDTLMAHERECAQCGDLNRWYCPTGAEHRAEIEAVGAEIDKAEQAARRAAQRDRAARCCDYCDQPATRVNTEAREILCTPCTLDQYTPDYRKAHVRALTDAWLVKLGRVTV